MNKGGLRGSSSSSGGLGMGEIMARLASTLPTTGEDEDDFGGKGDGDSAGDEEEWD